ncbi:MAG TPA: hypothetical protein VKD23_21770 [Terriglobales bacterium]|nr:hypothetical protein [Terriglobales bacterium]
MTKIITAGTSRVRSLCKRLLFVTAIALILAPVGAQAAGLVDILSLIKTITSTLQTAIGGVLSDIQTVNSEINKFRQDIVWPLNEIHQTRAFVSATRARYAGLMSQIESIRNNSANLANPKHLESVLRGGQPGGMGQFQQVYARVYAAMPQSNAAKPGQRDMMDIDDALAMDSLKTTIVSDQTTQILLSLADLFEQQSASAAPGSAPLLTAQARVTDLVSQAQMAKMFAAELRQEAAKLAHQNALLRQSALATRSLQNQMQQVLKHP